MANGQTPPHDIERIKRELMAAADSLDRTQPVRGGVLLSPTQSDIDVLQRQITQLADRVATLEIALDGQP